MREPYEINSNQYMPLNQEATNFTYCFFFCRIEVQGKDINRENQSNFQGRFDQLSVVGIKFDDDELELFLLLTLLDFWERFQVSMISCYPKQ